MDVIHEVLIINFSVDVIHDQKNGGSDSQNVVRESDRIVDVIHRFLHRTLVKYTKIESELEYMTNKTQHFHL